MAGLTGLTIAATYNSLLRTLADGGITTSLQVIEDGAGDDTCLQLSTKQFLVKSATDIDATFDIQNSSGHQLFTVDTVSSPEEVVINEGGLATVDFRVEGSSSSNALFVDGTNGRIGIGTATPTKILTIAHATDPTIFLARDEAAASVIDGEAVGRIMFGAQDSSATFAAGAYIRGVCQTDAYAEGDSVKSTRLEFHTQDESGSNTLGTPRMVVDRDGNVGIGTAAPYSPLHITSSAAGVIAEGDTNIPQVLIESTDSTAGSAGPILCLHNSSVAANNDYIGTVRFTAGDDASGGAGSTPATGETYASVTARVIEKATGTAAGQLNLGVQSGDALTAGLTVLGTTGGSVKVGIGTTAPQVGALNVVCASSFTAGKSDTAGHVIHIDNAAIAAGNGNYGGGISFSEFQYLLQTGAAIVSKQTSADPDSIGLAFFVHGTTDENACVERLLVDSGGVTITGALSKSSGTFKIDHPIPSMKNTHDLCHSFIEGPKADLIYRGVIDLVSGSASVNIDTAAGMSEGTFILLCDDVQCFTTNESNWDLVKGSVSGNILTLESENSDSIASISWMVIGDRKDQHIMDTEWTDVNGKPIVEPLKDNE